MDAVVPGSMPGFSEYAGTCSGVVERFFICFNNGFVDRKPIDFRSTSFDIVTCFGNAKFTRSFDKGGVGRDGDVDKG